MSRLKFPAWVLLFLIIICLLFPAASLADAPDDVKWARVNMPAEGVTGNWVLADGSDVRHLTRALDGTLYCYANPSGTTYRLFKSSDGGYTWSYTGKIEEDIVDIAVSPAQPGAIYCATTSKIYKSTDAGVTFSLLALNPGGAGAGNVQITSIDVATVDSGNILVVSTRDTDNLQYGGVYTLKEWEFTWTNTAIGNYDCLLVAFSPAFVRDRQIIAAVTDEVDTVITTSFSNAGWNQTVGDARISGLVSTSAALVFPADYNSDLFGGRYALFVALSTGAGAGDVYRIDGRTAPSASKFTDLNAGQLFGLNSVDVTSLAIIGNADRATIMAGAAGAAQVYFSTDSGKNWTISSKPPTGASATCVLLAADFLFSGVAYAATSGAQSALSISRDRGATWNQISLIDTRLTTINDLAISPFYNQDNTLFMLTFGVKHSLWRSLNGGSRWERVSSGALAHFDILDFVTISPRYNENKTILVAGTSDGGPVLWKSTDNGQTFIRMTSRNPDTGAPVNIDTWVVSSDNTVFVGSFDGTNGIVCRTAPNGLFYANKATAGSTALYSISLSPDFSQDKTILVGNTNGWVYWSDNNGDSFEPLPRSATAAPLIGAIGVAFDADFTRNQTVYAFSNTIDKGVYRFIIGKSSEWERIDTSLPAGGRLNRVVVSASGVLYTSNLQAVDTANKKGGIERCLDPAYPLGPTFETVIRGLPDGAIMGRLQLAGNRLWSIDSANARLLTYYDSLASPVALTAPADDAPGMPTSNVIIDWKGLEGANGYRWQLSYDTSFSSIPAGFEGSTSSTSARLPALEQNTKYYWRVRANDPVLSPWSARQSFFTNLNSRAIAPRLSIPEPAGKTPLKPIFQWSAIAGAEKYELLVSAVPSFSSLLIAKVDKDALPSTAWQSDVSLKPDTTYYWKVRALSSSSSSEWSAVSAFITESLPTASGPVTTTPLPAPPASLLPPSPLPASPASQPGTPGWAMWLIFAGGALAALLLIVLVLLALVLVRMSRR